ncbi:MAG: GYD domain-containing protein, partial [Pseudolabrys sp.]
RATMVTYVVLAKFTDQGAKTAKDSPKRAEAFKQMAKTFGVTVEDIFWTQGRYDIITVVEAPDELSATALNLSLSALGNIRTESLRAFSSAEMMNIVAKML